jgi:hypothetical protein
MIALMIDVGHRRLALSSIEPQLEAHRWAVRG